MSVFGRITVVLALLLAVMAFVVAWMSESDARQGRADLREVHRMIENQALLVDAIIDAQDAQGRLNASVVNSLRTVMRAQSRSLAAARG